MTPPNSPLPWTIDEIGNIVDARGVPVIAEDGAILPEDRDYIIAIVEERERPRKALEALARALEEIQADLKWISLTKLMENDLAAARRETEEMRKQTIEEIAQVIENEPIHSWVPGILAKRIRALSAQPDPHKSMTETLMAGRNKRPKYSKLRGYFGSGRVG